MLGTTVVIGVTTSATSILFFFLPFLLRACMMAVPNYTLSRPLLSVGFVWILFINDVKNGGGVSHKNEPGSGFVGPRMLKVSLYVS